MKIALVGYGKMGQMIEKVAINHGHTIVAKLSSPDWDPKALLEADICIEFTNPHSVLKNIQKIAASKKNVIIGTTGWNEHLDSIQSIVKENKIGALYSPNFSIGINLLLEILAQTSKIMNGFSEYDVAGIDLHHNQKKDSPSGTALAIERTITENMDRIDKVPFSSIRCGSIPGTHTILFDSPCDTISITHEARNREGFAEGAIQAAEWLQGKQGLYTFSDCMKEIIQRKLP
jgi:4-hydroxy-tetrahydrodipicolinate reductase